MITKLAGRYEIVREIGSGGMGRVYAALDTETSRTVAAKVLIAGEEVDLQALLRFQQEGAVLSTLKHPNIVQVYGTHLEERMSSIIMELLEGRSLGQILRDDRLTLARIKHLMQQTVSAIAYAHGRGIVHRDIKPDNIMVIAGDHVKVTDFGIVRLLQEGSTLSTKTGMALGTPLYMSPEQIDARKVDGRSDIYSLGIVMYQMVTGRPPFEGLDPLTIAFQHVHKAPPPPGEINADVPDDWEALILKCLAKNPDNRFQSAAALLEAVNALETASHTVVVVRERTRSELPADEVDAMQSQASEEARRRLEQGRLKEQTGEFPSALRNYRAALTVAPLGPVRDEVEACIARLSAKVQGAPAPTPTAPAEAAASAVTPPARPPRGSLPSGYLLIGGGVLAMVVIVAVAFALVSRGSSPPTAAPTSTPTSQSSGRGAFAANLKLPTEITVSGDGSLYVVAAGDSLVEEISASGKVSGQWGSHGSRTGQFNNPAAVAVDSQGNVYVADAGNNRIEKFAPTTDPIAQWGSAGTGPGQFKDPEGIALDAHGNLYVADSGNNRVQKLSPAGKPLGSVGTGVLSHPSGVAVDQQGNIYVADTGNSRIDKFSPNGASLGQWGSQGSSPGQFDRPTGITLDSGGDVYVADTGNNRIEELAPLGDPIAQWGTRGSGPTQLNSPRGVAVAGNNLYVADMGNNRIQRLSRSSASG